MGPDHALPTLEGSRLRLRQLRADDVPALFAVFSDARVMRYWSHAPFRTLDQAAWYLRDIDAGRVTGTHYQWGIVRRSDDRVIGTATLFAFDRPRRRAAIGYALAFEHWGNGYALEALQRLIAFAFSRLSLQRIEADIDARNTASLRLAGKLGFRQSSGQDASRPVSDETRPELKHFIDKYTFIHPDDAADE